VKVIYQDHRCKGCILEESQKSQVKDNVKNKDKLSFIPVAVHGKSREVIDYYGSKHKENIDRLSPGIEEKARKEQEYIYVFIFPKDPASKKYHRKKDHYENK
jgi:hypothetical protein